jgi:hypothetical protein
MATEQTGIDALLKEAQAFADPNQRSNALLRAFDAIWKRNRQLLGANLDAIMSFQVWRRGVLLRFSRSAFVSRSVRPLRMILHRTYANLWSKSWTRSCVSCQNVSGLLPVLYNGLDCPHLRGRGVTTVPSHNVSDIIFADLHALLPHVRAMIENTVEDSALLKHVITTLASTLPATLKYMKETPTKENKALWDALVAVIDGLAQREGESLLDPASSQACHKTLEVLVTLAGDEKWHKPHPFLNAMTLSKLASARLTLLTTWLSSVGGDSPAAHTRVASIISTVASIGVKVATLRVCDGPQTPRTMP